MFTTRARLMHNNNRMIHDDNCYEMLINYYTRCINYIVYNLQVNSKLGWYVIIFI